ncbi:MAG: hypothetical protein WC536_01435 [Patescibacteria group bacterium]
MKLEEHLSFLLNDNSFKKIIFDLRKQVGISEDGFKKDEDFNSWNETYSADALQKIVKSPGTIIDETSQKLIRSLSEAEDKKIDKRKLDAIVSKVLKKYKLPSAASQSILSFLIFNKIEVTPDKTKNYKAFLSYEDGQWNLYLKLSGICRAEDISWKKDIRPLQKFLADYTGSLRPLKDASDYKLITSKRNSKTKRKWKGIAYSSLPEEINLIDSSESKVLVNKRKNQLKAKNARLRRKLNT